MVFLAAASVHATLPAHRQRGSKLVDLPAPGREAEVCVVPKHFTNGAYTDEDLKTEGQLCDINTDHRIADFLYEKDWTATQAS
jgi:hypothetical protein